MRHPHTLAHCPCTGCTRGRMCAHFTPHSHETRARTHARRSQLYLSADSSAWRSKELSSALSHWVDELCLDPPKPKAATNKTKTGSDMLAGTGMADAAAASAAARVLPVPKDVPTHNRALTIGYICIVVCDISEVPAVPCCKLRAAS